MLRVISISEVNYIEAHGTGTALGDPTEAGALAAVHSARATPLAVGAAKASVGHSEAASGKVGLLKVGPLLQDVLALIAPDVDFSAEGDLQLAAGILEQVPADQRIEHGNSMRERVEGIIALRSAA